MRLSSKQMEKLNSLIEKYKCFTASTKKEYSDKSKEANSVHTFRMDKETGVKLNPAKDVKFIQVTRELKPFVFCPIEYSLQFEREYRKLIGEEEPTTTDRVMEELQRCGGDIQEVEERTGLDREDIEDIKDSYY